MIEKVVDCIDELDQPHLKLVMGPLLRNWPPTGPVLTRPGTRILDVIYGLWTLRSMTSPRALSTRPFDPVDQQFVNM